MECAIFRQSVQLTVGDRILEGGSERRVRISGLINAHFFHSSASGCYDTKIAKRPLPPSTRHRTHCMYAITRRYYL